MKKLNLLLSVMLITVLLAFSVTGCAQQDVADITSKGDTETAAPGNDDAAGDDIAETSGPLFTVDPVEAALENIVITEEEKVEIESSELNPKSGLSQDWLNIVLIGSDTRGSNVTDGRSDALIIASLNRTNGEIKLTSILRDLYVEIPQKGFNRINAAYAFGGPNLTMLTLNEIFDLNITEYVAINFKGLEDVIDRIGGIDLDIRSAELPYINLHMDNMEKLGYSSQPRLDKYGEGTHLTGRQAVGYARIRHLDGDVQRTSRQRAILNAVFAKAKDELSMMDLTNAITELFESVGTNLTQDEILSLLPVALQMASGISIQELTLPYAGTFNYSMINGMSVQTTDLEVQSKILHDFIYEDKLPEDENTTAQN